MVITDYLWAFLIGGGLCLIAQLIMDIFKLLPIHITVLYVSLGAVLEMFNLYDKLIKVGKAGALMPISSFGHSLTHGAIEEAMDKGILGLFTGIFDLTTSGMVSAIIFSFIFALIFKPKG